MYINRLKTRKSTRVLTEYIEAVPSSRYVCMKTNKVTSHETKGQRK